MWQTTKRSKQSRRPPVKERRRERGDNSVGSLGSNGAPAGSVEHSISRNEPDYSDNEGERDRDDSLPNSMKATSLKETNQIIDLITASTVTTNETAVNTNINTTIVKESGDNDVAKDEAEEEGGERGEGVKEGVVGGEGEDDHSEISKHSSEEVSENDEDDNDDQDGRNDGNKNEEGKERGSTTQPGQTNKEDDKGHMDQKKPSEKKKKSKSKKDKIRDKRKQREKERERTRQEEANARRTMMRQEATSISSGRGAAAKSKVGKQKMFYSSDDGSNVRSDPAHHIHVRLGFITDRSLIRSRHDTKVTKRMKIMVLFRLPTRTTVHRPRPPRVLVPVPSPSKLTTLGRIL